MARIIKATPALGPKETAIFYDRLEQSSKRKKGLIPTPKAKLAMKRIVENAQQGK